MEDVLNEILVEVKGVKKEVREVEKRLRNEMQEMKTEIFEVMDEKLEKNKIEIFEVMDEKLEKNKVEIFEEMDLRMDQRFDKQSKEIAEEFHNLVAYFEEKFRKLDKVNNEILKEIKRNRIEHKQFDARIGKIEFEQNEMQEKMLKIG